MPLEPTQWVDSEGTLPTAWLPQGVMSLRGAGLRVLGQQGFCHPACSEEVFVLSITPQTLFEFHRFSHCHPSSAALLMSAWPQGATSAGQVCKVKQWL